VGCACQQLPLTGHASCNNPTITTTTTAKSRTPAKTNSPCATPATDMTSTHHVQLAQLQLIVHHHVHLFVDTHHHVTRRGTFGRCHRLVVKHIHGGGQVKNGQGPIEGQTGDGIPLQIHRAQFGQGTEVGQLVQQLHLQQAHMAICDVGAYGWGTPFTSIPPPAAGNTGGAHGTHSTRTNTPCCRTATTLGPA